MGHAGIDKSPRANHCAGFRETKESRLKYGSCPQGAHCLVWDLGQMGKILANDIHLPVGSQMVYHEALNLQLTPFPISLRHTPTTRTICLLIVHINRCQIVPVIWGWDIQHSREQFKGRRGALFSHPFRLHRTHFMMGEPRFQTNRKETESKLSALTEPVTCLLGEQQPREEPSMLKKQLLSLQAALLPTPSSFPCPSLESIFISSTAWLGSEGDSHQPLNEKPMVDAACRAIFILCRREPQQNHKLRFALDSLAFFGNYPFLQPTPVPSLRSFLSYSC